MLSILDGSAHSATVFDEPGFGEESGFASFGVARVAFELRHKERAVGPGVLEGHDLGGGFLAFVLFEEEVVVAGGVEGRV